MHNYYIGLLSGTSIDAVDAAIVDFSVRTPRLVATHSEPIPAPIKKQVLALCHPGDNEIERLGQLDRQLGYLFAQACSSLLAQAKIPAEKISAIGSHGQSIRHRPGPEFRFTLQIGDANIIAENTGITTIADFRRRDMALGGQGAPLAPAFHQSVFHSPEVDRVILNIGGIANVTLLPRNNTRAISGFDTGPGNTLLDAWILNYLGKPFDRNGQWAQSGKVNKAVLSALLDDPYFKIKPPKSTGPEYFNLSWLEKIIQQTLPTANIKAEDIQATLTELTARTIIQSLDSSDFSADEWLVCGGGVHNDYLIDRLRALQPKQTFSSTDKVGIPADWVEAMLFAWLAKQTLARKPGNIPSVTGAKKAAVLGSVYYGANL